MAKAISVKVKVSTLISALEKALADREKRYAEQEADEAKYEKATEAYKLAVLKAIKAGKGEIEEASRNHWYDRNLRKKGKTSFSVTVLLPNGAIPTEPEQPRGYSEHEYNRDKRDISQAIRVLKMTDQEYASANTYKSVDDYL